MKLKTMMPVRFIFSSFFVVVIVFLLMFCWYITLPVTITVINIIGNMLPGSEGNAAIAVLKTGMNLWGPIAVVVFLIGYALLSTQKRDPRGYYD